MKRRAFIAGLFLTPALVRASSLEYIPRGLIMPKPWFGMKWTFRDARTGRLLREVISGFITDDDDVSFNAPDQVFNSWELRDVQRISASYQYRDVDGEPFPARTQTLNPHSLGRFDTATIQNLKVLIT